MRNKIIMLLCVLFIIPQFIGQTEAIGQHEEANGIAIGIIEDRTIRTMTTIVRPNADYEVTGWTLSGSSPVPTAWQSVDENAHNDDVDCVNSTGGTYRFLIELEDISTTQNISINWVKIHTWMKSLSSNGPHISALSRIGGILYYGAGIISTTWTERTVTYSINPKTGSTWKASDINSMQIGGFSNRYYNKEASITQTYLEINHSYSDTFDVNRTVSVNIERNNFSFVSSGNYTDNVTLTVPVSYSVRGIIDVTNNTCMTSATEVNSTSELINNTFWYDSANQYVYIRTINITYGMVVNWTVNCSYGMSFNIPIPTYKEVGDDIIMSGRIVNSSGVGMNVSARTHIYNITGVDVVSPVHEWYCFWGNYQCTIPTSGLIPGVYTISIEITNPDTGITFKYGDTLYLSFETPSGVYSDAIVHFSFYNTNVGLGLIPETFKVYIDDARIYEYKYYGYTGQTINVTVRDYYDFIMRTDDVTITETYTGLNYGLTFHEYHFTNENGEAFYASFLKDGASLWYEKVVPCSGGQNSFMLPTGNYTVRVYNADNSSYISWNDTVNRSKAYLIGTDGVTLIIAGLSVIDGTLLEFRDDLDYALMPDAVIWSTNPPIIISCFDRIGMMLGQNVWKVCPALNVIATTRNATTGNWINSTYLIPSNGTTENGTITLLEDTIYIYGNGSVDWVNLTYTDNGTLYQNTTYIPGMLHVFGENFTINASCDIRVERETRYNQLKKFYWDITNYTINPGHIAGRAGYHTAGIEVINSLNTTLYDVYVFIGFSDKTSPDANTVQIRDVENGVLLERGENFKTTEDGVDFRLTGSMNASSTRNFVAGYYSDFSSNYIYDDGQVYVTSFETNKKYGSRTPFYNYFKVPFINDRSLTFRGGVFAILNLRMLKTEIDLSSVLVRDLDNNIEVERSDYVIEQGFLLLTSEIVGDVSPGGGRNFGVYFLESEYPGVNPEDIHLNTNIGNFLGFSWTPFFIIFLIMCIPMAVGVVRLVWDKSKKLSSLNLVITVVPFVFLFILWIFSAKGM